jgi:hypothetical protein
MIIIIVTAMETSDLTTYSVIYTNEQLKLFSFLGFLTALNTE